MKCLLLLLAAIAAGEWLLVVRLEQDSPARRRKVGDQSPAACSTCTGKLADATINALMDSNVVKLELVRRATEECCSLPSVAYFDVGIGNFDSLAQRPASPFSLSESQALAGNFSFSPPALNFSSSTSSSGSSASSSYIVANANVSSGARMACNFGANFGPLNAAYAWLVNGSCVCSNVCTDLMLVSVWIADAPSPALAATTGGSSGVISVSYFDFLLYGGLILALLLLGFALFCICYHYRRKRKKKAKKRAKNRDMAEMQCLSLVPPETTSLSSPSERNSLHADPQLTPGFNGVPSLLQDDMLASCPLPTVNPPYSARIRTPPYTKSTFPTGKTILPLTPIRDSSKRSVTPPMSPPQSPPRTPQWFESAEHKHRTSPPLRFNFRKDKLTKLSPTSRHIRANSSPNILSPKSFLISPTAARRNSTSSPCGVNPVFSSGTCPYFVVRLLGKGHFGTAYLVTDHVNLYVLKTLSTARSEAQKNDALKEALSLASFPPSPHLLAFRDFFFEGQVFCIVVNYCSGGSLLDQIPLRLPPDEIFRILVEICVGLSIIHAKGFIHRDIKPDNLFFANPEERLVVIGDMGLTRRVDGDGYYANPLGHTLYKAPEVQCGKWSRRSDMWAAGCVGLDLLGGESMEQRCKSQNMILGMKNDTELSEIIQATVGNLVHPVVKVVRSLLRVNPYRRLTAEQVIEYKAAVDADPSAEPPCNPAHDRVKSCSVLTSVVSPSNISHQELSTNHEILPLERAPSPPLSSPSPIHAQPISPQLRSRKFSFSALRKEASARTESAADTPKRSRKSVDEPPEEFSPLITPVVFYSAQ